MRTLTLTRRRTQLGLLRDVCADRQRLRLRLAAGAGDEPEVYTRFFAWQAHGLLLDWPAHGTDNIPLAEAEVVGFFRHDGEPFRLLTHTAGRVWWNSARRGLIPMWQLAQPLRVERWHERQHYRRRLTDMPPITARLMWVGDPRRQFTACLQNLSTGGLNALVANGSADAMRPGETLWVDFALPDGGRFEFVARVTHATPRADGVALGCRFCPSDDPTLHRAQLERLTRFVLRRATAAEPAAEPAGVKGAWTSCS
jgi:hypothetical protein